MTTRLTSLTVFLSIVAVLIACARAEDAASGSRAEGDASHAGPFDAVTEAVCVLMPTEGNDVQGWVRFVEANGSVTVTAEVSGLTPNAQHAIHIHEFGDLTKSDGTSAGGHYNPEGHEHGLPDQPRRHAGDFGNLQADANGMATFRLVVDNITIAGDRNPILGRGMIVHAAPDDGGQPTGNAGARIAMGVIGVASPGD